MDPYVYIQDPAALLADVPADSILSRTVHDDDHVKVVLFRFAAGQELSEHTSSYAAVLSFLEGEADVTLGSDRLSAQAGTWAFMTPRLPHSITARTPTTMLLMMLKGR